MISSYGLTQHFMMNEKAPELLIQGLFLWKTVVRHLIRSKYPCGDCSGLIIYW
jgi:hypothetical protein